MEYEDDTLVNLTRECHWHLHKLFCYSVSHTWQGYNYTYKSIKNILDRNKYQC